MSFLGQALQRSPRTPPGVLRIIGIDVISTAGAFSWTAPALVEYVDIIAVAASPGTGNGEGGGGSGQVCQRVMKPVVPGQTFSGTIGNTTAAVRNSFWGQTAGSTTVDGMTAVGATAYLGGGTYSAAPSGGDINLPGILGDNTPIPSLALGLTAGNGPRIIDPLASGLGASNPGGGAGVSSAGQVGSVFFVMYRRKT